MYSPLQVGEVEYPAFRATSMFETFADYLTRHTDSIADLEAERCTVTGQVVSRREPATIKAMIHMVATEVVGALDKDILNPPTQSDLESWAEVVFDRINYRLIMTSRPSPLFAVSAGRMVLAHMSQQAQTVALLSMLLLDPINRRAIDFESDDLHNRICAVFALADDVDGLFESEAERMAEIHSLLVELDAKYSIMRLKLTAHERGIKDNVLSHDIVGDLKTLKHFLVTMLNHRDANVEVVDDQKRWTQEAMANGLISAVKRTNFSNVFATMQKENKPSNRHVKRAAESKPKAKPGRPVKDHAKADRRARMAALMAQTFAKKE